MRIEKIRVNKHPLIMRGIHLESNILYQYQNFVILNESIYILQNLYPQ